MSEVHGATAVSFETEYEAWSTPDDFDWQASIPEAVRSRLVGEAYHETDIEPSDVYAGLRALMDEGDDPVELIESLSTVNYGNRARRRLGGGLWATLDTELAPSLSVHADMGGEPRQRLAKPMFVGKRRRLRNWDLIPHGTVSSYVNLCNPHPDGPCDACKAAKAAYERERCRRAKEQ